MSKLRWILFYPITYLDTFDYLAHRVFYPEYYPPQHPPTNEE